MDELVDDTLFLRPSSVNTLTSKKSYNWLWILGGVLIIIILFIWIISNSDELKTRYEFFGIKNFALNAKYYKPQNF